MKTEEKLAFCALEKRLWNMLQYLKEKKYDKLEGSIKALHSSMVNLAYELKNQYEGMDYDVQILQDNLRRDPYEMDTNEAQQSCDDIEEKLEEMCGCLKICEDFSNEENISHEAVCKCWHDFRAQCDYYAPLRVRLRHKMEGDTLCLYFGVFDQEDRDSIAALIDDTNLRQFFAQRFGGKVYAQPVSLYRGDIIPGVRFLH